MAISSDHSCIAIAAGTGSKSPDPALDFYLPDDDRRPGGGELGANSITPQLLYTAYTLALDTSRKTIFIGDRTRVKSYSWDQGLKGTRGDPVHTLRSGRHTGPLAICYDTKIFRSGRGSVLSWNIEQLETHGPEGKRIGKGKAERAEASQEPGGEDGNEYEDSTGSRPHATIELQDNDLQLHYWDFHQPSNLFFFGAGTTFQATRPEADRYLCGSLDLEHKGTIVTRFLGHGGNVEHISHSDGDPQIFVTAAGDGFVRTFDSRTHCPVMTFDVEEQNSPCYAALLVHPGGVPSELFSIFQSRLS